MDRAGRDYFYRTNLFEPKPCLHLEKSDDAVMKGASVVLLSLIPFLAIGILLWGCSREPTSNQIQNGALMDDDFDQLRKKAEAGDSTAQYKLGVMYLFAQGVEKNHVDAYAWFNLSAANGSDNAAWRRDSIKRLLSPQQISDAEKRTEELKKLMAEEQAASE